jgi:KUP system potassium uptake protein
MHTPFFKSLRAFYRQNKGIVPESMREAIKSLGIVFGDIGTSPIYTLYVIFILSLAPTVCNVLGVLSLIVWTLITVVTIQYAWLAMSLSQKGEGGTIVLREILVPLLKRKKTAYFFTMLSFVGISFLIGDGVITPAISVLSAVEGLRLIPGWEAIQQNILVIVAALITIVLFAFQRKGTETVSVAFGPIMVVWFLTLGATGLCSLWYNPSVLAALSPHYAILFLINNGWQGFFVLSKVILCATGGEALYADMGHLGRTPIIRAWGFAFILLVLNYLGQGAYLIAHPDANSVFYEMFYSQAPGLYVPFLLLSLIATVIASQAMISGIFSIVYQGITTNVLPKLKVDYTSRKLRSQIYIPFVNWSLLILVLIAIFKFGESINLANAYGLAATCTMTITSIMVTTIFYLQRSYCKAGIAGLILLINCAYLGASTSKIPSGGYWSILIALIPLTLIMIYTAGKKRLYERLRPVTMDEFVSQFKHTLKDATLIHGTGVFFSSGVHRIPSYMVHTMFSNNIIYEENIIVSVVTQDKPFGVTANFAKDKTLPEALRLFEIRMGYMEIMNLEKILRAAHIEPKVIFYGMEEIGTKNIFWKVFAVIKKLTPSFVQFYKLPTNKLHGVLMRVEM